MSYNKAVKEYTDYVIPDCAFETNPVLGPRLMTFLCQFKADGGSPKVEIFQPVNRCISILRIYDEEANEVMRQRFNTKIHTPFGLPEVWVQ